MDRRSAEEPLPASGTPGRRPLIAGLTGVRAIMGLWIVADHLRGPLVNLLPAASFLTPVLSGGIALDTFFILSGFVMSHVYAERLATLDRRSYGAFLWARFARLWPTHVVGLLLMAGVVAYIASLGSTLNKSQDYSAWTFLGNLAMLQSFPGVNAWNSPSWSVCTEFVAYLFFPFAAGLIARAGRVSALVSAGVLVVAMAVVLYLLPPTSIILSAFWVRPVSEIALGCLLWSAWRDGPRRHWRWDVVAAASLAAILLVAYSAAGTPLRYAAIPLLGLFVVAVATSAGPVLRILTSRPVEWAGRNSYSRYLVHAPVLTVLWLFFPSALFTHAPLSLRIGIVAAWLIATFGAGGITYRLVEEPARRWLKRRGDAWGIGFSDRRPVDRPVDAAEPALPAEVPAG